MPRLSWQLKAILPIVVVVVNGLLLFVLATSAIADPERKAALIVATAGAIIICAVLLIVLALVVRLPMRELQQKIAYVRDGDLNVRLDFAERLLAAPRPQGSAADRRPS